MSKSNLPWSYRWAFFKMRLRRCTALGRWTDKRRFERMMASATVDDLRRSGALQQWLERVPGEKFTVTVRKIFEYNG